MDNKISIHLLVSIASTKFLEERRNVKLRGKGKKEVLRKEQETAVCVQSFHVIYFLEIIQQTLKFNN